MPSKRQQQRPSKGLPSTRSRTRSSKAILYDPAQNTQLLNQQLHALGLYAAQTIGDGNCLFRALSDQLYGTQNYHSKLRDEICDWIAARPDRYAPFVDDERGLDVHLRCMRTPGTYGGHLELSAFAHLKRRNVKVIQPGLVYIIEWNTGVGDASSSADDADRRRLRRTKHKADKTATAAEPDEAVGETVYVAYHDWEHFSSVRNITGPHNGIPNVVESPAPAPETQAEPGTPSKHKLKQSLKVPKRVTRSSTSKAAAAPPAAPSPADIPLPPSPEPRSRASSPATQLSTSSAASVSTAPSSVQPASQSSPKPKIHLRLRPPSSREGRSPKRTFDESEQDDSEPAGRTKRQRQRTVDDEMDWALAEPEPQDAGAMSDTSSLSSLSDLEDDADADGSGDVDAFSESSLSAPPSPPRTPAKPLTRRQRKVLGLPKPRSAPVPSAGANKIKIPGGRYRGGKENSSAPTSSKQQGAPPDKDSAKGEWVKNGVGRLDVRGFRELRI
ncbi:cysteine proteinase [Exidia glandulosa HHB12029]|uniref:Cysteine proteinase n=1 Tax=Exidia glandulosa HHB12029 TaxID=1314781 RepID=A0A165BM96_EXIGL|nr:cysteine proteinase [Exidia glandulosa HHB12029]